MNLVQTLQSFNRKERFYLLGWALGNQSFTLDASFRDELGKRINLAIPEEAYAAMDYHLDWIYASLFLANQSDARSSSYERGADIQATQEDVDMVVAFQERETFHLIMLEAKATTGWTNAQLKHKMQRLETIFGPTGTKWERVTPHFVITSPVEPARVLCDDWPAWMTSGGKPYWLPMKMPGGLRRITRCDSNGRPSFSGSHWTVLPRSTESLPSA